MHYFSVTFVLVGYLSVCFGQGLQCNPLDPKCLARISAQTGCNVLDPQCRQQIASSVVNGSPDFGKSSGLNPKKCRYPNLWLIPGKADTSCTRKGVPNVLNIRAEDVEIHPKTIQLPGCFTIKVSGTVTQSSKKVPESYMGKASYQWWNLKEFSSLKCQNASNNGCGGFGNNCNYCDICQSLTDLRDNTGNIDITKSQQRIVNQFKGMKCPKGPGEFSIVKEFCFNDWSALDADGDCKFDFLSGEDLGGYKSALQSLNQLGFGTVVANFKLAHNATSQQILKKTRKEAEIEKRVRKELRQRRESWDVSNGQFGTFQDWYIQYRKDNWHRNRYLPWLFYTNEVACLKVTFDVCDKRPTPVSVPWALVGHYNGPSMQCV